MKNMFHIVLISLLALSLYGCGLIEPNAIKNRLRHQCYMLEKIYPTRNIDDLIIKFPNGYHLIQHYKMGDISFELDMQMNPDDSLRGTWTSDEEYEVVYDNSKFICDDPDFFGMFLFQRLELNKDILSKQKESIVYNWIEGTGGTVVYEMSDPLINLFFHKELNECFRLSVPYDSDTEYTLTIDYDDGTFYYESVRALD